VRKIRNSEKQTIASLYLTIQRKKVRTVAYNPAIEKENRDVNSQLSFLFFYSMEETNFHMIFMDHMNDPFIVIVGSF